MSNSVNQLKKDTQKSTTQRRLIKIDSTPRWVRVKFNGLIIADSKEVLVLHERGHLPVYYFPEKDVTKEVLVTSDKRSHCPLKGDASYWTIKVGDRTAENAVWSYQNPIPESKEIKGYFSFYWNQVDAWFEEEEEIYVHPRDPYKRVDALLSSRHIKVVLEGKTVAESRRPVIVFETGVPVRYYLPKEDVAQEVLELSNLKTRCPYKGIASYWSVIIDGNSFEDIVWSYPHPIPEIPKIAGLLSFYNERVEIYVDGELQKKPEWHYSALDFINSSEI
ncbi:DUF427 domain-containing protein [Neobacillus sp. SuZ13]|uniref:DUF427 domain-containing protein n=1 Tax=Neobacillus sp. SuZ13 TaxID=3047875 RepID=UPI0024BFB577|nr:DUF427 domain-containing protein [Neobacillus sp. SuZ13]WHY69009.1 DUF427 domain-containing protein [Neobacillus sp. SuZ13]